MSRESFGPMRGPGTKHEKEIHPANMTDPVMQATTVRASSTRLTAKKLVSVLNIVGREPSCLFPVLTYPLG